MSHSSHFDYIIIGTGLAGLQLALKMASDVFFDDKQIALIDYSKKNTNDKTWSFWETEASQWSNIIHKSWRKASVITSQKTIDLQLKPYVYKSIRSIDFYNKATSKLKKHSNFHFIIDRVNSVKEENESVIITAKQNTFTASHVFDSRVPESFSLNSKHNISINQHFKGWIIKTDFGAFDDSKLIMMDYRLKDGNQTTFTYVLPFSKTEALVEFTYFTEQLVNEETYDKFIKTYIKEYLNIDNYTIAETETGIIPMTNFPFEKYHTKRITKIGTGGGWVKGSTGYSFKHTEKKTTKIVENIKANKTPSNHLIKRKYKFYDKVFLKVLKDENGKGEWIFQQFYAKNSVKTMFKFLDEESTFFEDLKIMSSLFSLSFIKAFFRTL
ncbi:lycopene cyclase family protein [Hwangdonia lutea]|uniref:Lycopene cyclase family protein n=1 Tax=Hwangdonia lutea TaxID=3075823 RepID=A0AA97EM19_9FLAO|nr:lycopene cyclase family protein [Hwangdonia sp. SCSIO 19198]WOD43901.1 lycopene cyclase family protein [Hwangdonia sp. SCSIO 19198]